MAEHTIDVTLTPHFEQELFRRTVAALEATRGISTDDLESGAVARLVEAARDMLNLIEASIEIDVIQDSENIYERGIDALAPFEKV